MSYAALDVYVPVTSHDQLLANITKFGPLGLKVAFTGTQKHKIYVTLGQAERMEDATKKDRKSINLFFSARQVNYNIVEGGFLGEILLAAARFLPKIVAGIAGGDYQKYGNGMFLGKDMTLTILRNLVKDW